MGSHSLTPQQSQPQTSGGSVNSVQQQQVTMGGNNVQQMGQQNMQQNVQHHQINNGQNKQPNPTVNALILHTGNNAQNVNINIYADGQSGQNNQKKQQQQQQNNNNNGGNMRGYNPRSRPNSFQ